MPKQKKAKEKKGKAEEREVKEEPFPKIPFLSKRDSRNVQRYVEAVLRKFGKYIKSMVIWGSVKTGVGKSKKSDIDIAVIVDDTDVRTMTREEVKEKLFQRLVELAYPISKKLHPQPYLLTEFWEYVREGNPVLFNVLKDGVPLYDTGFFVPIQMIFRMGNIKPSKEAIDKHMYVAKELIKLAKNTLLEKLSYDLEQAVVSSTQAVLMELGYRPPAPKEIPNFVEEVLVKKEKLVDEKFAEIAKEIIQTYKDIEHRERKEYLGSEFEKHCKLTEKYVEKMEQILKKLRKEKGESYKFELVEKLEKAKVRRDGMVSLPKKKRPEEKAEKMIKEELGQR
ncbi:hypothetical protein DRN62_01415 [Nanoarchaeota archaeon]|nr:MAG: hypothetical protein DRN62_01415 [Nanoarchaeota archaeon]